MNKILIASFDMEVGGVERSLISMLNHFNYKGNHVDLMLYSHSGDFLHLLPENVRLLKESPTYKTFRMSIGQVMKTGKIHIGMTRLIAKWKAYYDQSPENGYKQMQYMWYYALPFLPKIKQTYDVAISYLWPHYVVAEKVEANIKIAWVHTDFSTVETDEAMDIQMWKQFDYIVAVSEACKDTFIKKYPILRQKMITMENIMSPDIVRSLANEIVENPMLADKRFKVLTVARLSHAKGIDQAVKALRIIKDKGYPIVWYVVGYGGDEGALKNLIAKEDLEDVFILLGKQINPYPFMKAADLYVQPSRYEGKAVTVEEAQILSKPVLITNYPTASSQVTDGKDGIICDLSIDGIAEGIITLYKNDELREQLGARCKQTNYQNTAELLKLYELI